MILARIKSKISGKSIVRFYTPTKHPPPNVRTVVMYCAWTSYCLDDDKHIMAPRIGFSGVSEKQTRMIARSFCRANGFIFVQTKQTKPGEPNIGRIVPFRGARTMGQR